MRAYQCDRCGNFFAHLCASAVDLFITDTRASAAWNRIKDLCDDCQRELEAWWKIPKKEKEEVEDDKRRGDN